MPIKAYEAAITEGGRVSDDHVKFVELEYGIETGEAERIAVDGISRGGTGDGEESSGGKKSNLEILIFSYWCPYHATKCHPNAVRAYRSVTAIYYRDCQQYVIHFLVRLIKEKL